MRYNSVNGLIKIESSTGTSYTFPVDKIKLDSYKITYNSQDLNSFRDCNGGLVKNTLPTRVPKVVFQTKNQLTETEFEAIMSAIRSRYVVEKDRAVKMLVFVPELNDYYEGMFYLADPDVSIYRIGNPNSINPTLYYNPVTFTFVGYGKLNL